MSVLQEVNTPQMHDRIEAALSSQRPFGSSGYIKREFQASYCRRLLKISDAEPLAGEMLAALDTAENHIVDRLLSDTAVRTIIDHTRRRVVSGESGARGLAPTALCREVLEAACEYLAKGKRSGPLCLTAQPRLGPAEYHPWIWTNSRAGDAFGKAYQWLVEAIYGGMPEPVGAREINALQSATQLLEELVPQSAKSVLGHTQIVAVIPASGVWRRMQSSSQYLLGGNIFLSDLVFDKPWLLAELLYHESIHQKLYDFRRGHRVLYEDSRLDPDLVPPSDVLVPSPWNYPDNQWDTHRVLAAFHVYVHVAHLSSVADRRAPELEEIYGPRTRMTPSSIALDRARYLGEQLKRTMCWTELGPAGKGLADWLLSMLQAMDENPAPQGAQLHLMLHRYEREANRIERIATDEDSELAYQADLLSFDEVGQIESLLERLGRNSAAKDLHDYAQSVADSKPGQRFAALRRAILVAVRDCSADGYTIPATSAVDPTEIVTSMIERSSRLLATASEVHKSITFREYPALIEHRRRGY